jgi:hypothetical protein
MFSSKWMCSHNALCHGFFDDEGERNEASESIPLRKRLFRLMFNDAYLQSSLGQQRSHSLLWDDQSVSESEFRVHSFEVFSGANVLSAIVTIVSQQATRTL